MVSTRGYKYKFADGEKVLCFEPDLKVNFFNYKLKKNYLLIFFLQKAKVLYDSKVIAFINCFHLHLTYKTCLI
jgi:hypothetical protein